MSGGHVFVLPQGAKCDVVAVHICVLFYCSLRNVEKYPAANISKISELPKFSPNFLHSQALWNGIAGIFGGFGGVFAGLRS